MVSKFSEKEMRACTTGACTREEHCNPTRCGVCVRTKQYNDHNAKFDTSANDGCGCNSCGCSLRSSEVRSSEARS